MYSVGFPTCENSVSLLIVATNIFIEKMSDDDEFDDLMLAYIFLRGRARRCKVKRSVWVRDKFMKRKERGTFHTLVQEMRLNDRESYFR